MNLFRKHPNILKKLGLAILTVLVVVGGSLWQSNVLKVQAAVQVLLVSRTAIAFGTVFPGQDPTETYTVQLDTSANSAVYVTTLGPLAGQQNLCPFLQLTNIDSPPEPDTLASSTLTRPGDVLDKWQVKFNVPGIKGQLSQDHNGGIIIQGGDFGCKITITTQDPTQIIIQKKTVGADGTFSYTGDLGAFNLTTQNNSASQTFGGLSAGTYHVTEPAQAGWQFTSLVCTDPSGDTTVNGATATIHVANFETVTCTYTNTQQKKGKIIICKKSVDGTGSFNFSGDLGAFNIQTQSSGSKNNYYYKDDNSGDCGQQCEKDGGGHGSYGYNSYGYGNSYNKDYKSDDGDCDKDDGNSDSYGSNGHDSYGNRYGSNGRDSYGSGSQNATGEKVFSNLAPGNYNVNEIAQSGWDLTSLVCNDPGHNSTVAQNIASIKLGSGETVICTYTNTKQKKGNIIIQKKTSGGDGKFYFSGDLGPFNITTQNNSGSQSFNNINAGSYSVSESSQSGWKLYSIVCTDPSHNTTTYNSTANIKLAAGETITCTFTNKKQGKIIIHKKTGGGGDSCDFSGDLGNFNIQTQNGYGTKEVDNLDAGNYNISENPKGGYSPYSVICTNSAGKIINNHSASINLEDGQTVDCTFQNIKKN